MAAPTSAAATGWWAAATGHRRGRRSPRARRHGARLSTVGHHEQLRPQPRAAAASESGRGRHRGRQDVDVDLGRVNGDYFANLVSIGVSAAMAGQTPRPLKRRLGRAAYVITGLRTLLTHRPFDAVVRRGITWRVITHQLDIANGACTRARPSPPTPGRDAVAAGRAQGLPHREPVLHHHRRAAAGRRGR